MEGDGELRMLECTICRRYGFRKIRLAMVFYTNGHHRWARCEKHQFSQDVRNRAGLQRIELSEYLVAEVMES